MINSGCPFVRGFLFKAEVRINCNLLLISSLINCKVYSALPEILGAFNCDPPFFCYATSGFSMLMSACVISAKIPHS